MCVLQRPEEGGGFLELVLEVVVRHITWVLRTKLRSSGKAILVLHHCAVSPAARIHFFDKLVAPFEPLDFLFPRGSQLWKLVRE